MDEMQFQTAIIDTLPDALIATDSKFRIKKFNKAAESLYGFKKEELVGKDISEILLTETNGFFHDNALFESLKAKGFWSGEIIQKRKNGTFVTVMASISVIKNAKERMIGFVGTYRDITDRKAAEEYIKSNVERLGLALEAGKIGIWDWDVNSNHITWSDKVYDIHGVTKEQFDGKLETLLSLFHPDDAGWVGEAIKTAMIEKKPYALEFRFIRPDGSIRWLLTSGKVYFDHKGQPYRMLGAVQDITERKNLERQKDDFISIATHELKTPVTSIKAYTQILHNRFKKMKDYSSAELAGKMNLQLNKLINLIGDLLDASKIESGKLEFNKGYFDINELIQEIVEEIGRTTEKHKLLTRLAPTRKVYGDKDRIGQVLTNLLTNAIKYWPSGGDIAISSTNAKDSITISVLDFGIGIPPDNKEKIFERFYRVTGAERATYGGLGLGLYISSEIIKRSKGTIWVESDKEKGTKFSFTLPTQK